MERKRGRARRGLERRENPGGTADGRDRATREALLDLAYDVSSYLRRSAQPAVRVSAALLIAASLAACGPTAGAIPGVSSVVQPLQGEVRSGLPPAPGRYPVVSSTLRRDAQGVYSFAWQQPGDPSHQYDARISRLQLTQGNAPELQVPAQGDPVLALPADVSIPLVDSGATWVSSPGGGYSSWRPFYGGGYHGTAYYDPPVRAAPSSGATIDGARSSAAPAPPAERTIGVRGAVSSRAGGAGAGTAATNKSGASAASVDHGGAAAAKSSGFSAGHAASSGGGSSS